MREGIPKRRASPTKTTRGKSNVDKEVGRGERGRQTEADAMAFKDVVKKRASDVK